MFRDFLLTEPRACGCVVWAGLSLSVVSGGWVWSPYSEVVCLWPILRPLSVLSLVLVLLWLSIIILWLVPGVLPVLW